MKALLDTHVFLWWITDDPRLSTVAREIVGDGHHELYLSAASGWEIAIKAGLGRLKFGNPIEQEIPRQLSLNNILVLPVHLSHGLAVAALPPLHRDPFDRLLVAQCHVEQIPILTADALIKKYPVQTLW